MSRLEGILNSLSKFGANAVVDETHGLGVYGRTNIHDLSTDTSIKKMNCESQIDCIGVLFPLKLDNHPALLGTVFTFGLEGVTENESIPCSTNITFNH